MFIVCVCVMVHAEIWHSIVNKTAALCVVDDALPYSGNLAQIVKKTKRICFVDDALPQKGNMVQYRQRNNRIFDALPRPHAQRFGTASSTKQYCVVGLGGSGDCLHGAWDYLTDSEAGAVLQGYG